MEESLSALLLELHHRLNGLQRLVVAARQLRRLHSQLHHAPHVAVAHHNVAKIAHIAHVADDQWYGLKQRSWSCCALL